MDEFDIGYIVFMLGLAAYAIYVKTRSKGNVDALLEKAETKKVEGNYKSAFENYKKALGIAFGIKGNTEWTAQGLSEKMEEKGWDIIDAIEGLYSSKSVNYDFSILRGLVTDFEAFSKDESMVDNYGLPKSDGKAIYKGMRSKLIEIYDDMPEI